MAQKNKIELIINTPSIGNSGGVANFYRNLEPHFGDNVLLNEVTFSGDRKPSPLQQIGLFIKFIFILLKNPKADVLINPSFNFKAVRRDKVYIQLAKLLGRDIFVFWHGWSKSYWASLKDKSGKGFKKSFNYPKRQFVLASEFIDNLREIGITGDVQLATTCVDNRLLSGAEKLGGIQPKSSIQKLLFISRIEEEKGVFETVDAFVQIRKSHSNLELNIAGTGGADAKLRAYIESNQIKGVNLLGYVRNEDKLKCYLENDALVFPTYHGEGMPLTLLESLSFGLVIFTTDVGGIKDFFNPNMGSFVQPKSSNSVVRAISPFLENPQKVHDTSKFNYAYAIEKYQAKDVAARLLRNILA